MGTYVPGTREEQLEMLKACGYQSFEELYAAAIPEKLRLRKELNIPEGKPEILVRRELEALSKKNHVYQHIFRGAGAYNHYIPAIVNEVTSREEFRTAYTPYQAEISQGVLQSIFEYQSDICFLTGLDAANASVYDGATAAAEGLMMTRQGKKTELLVSETVDPRVLSVIRTYAFGRDAVVKTVPEKDGVTDLQALREMVTEETAGVLIASPNFYGNIEDVDSAAEVVHEKKALLVMFCNPLSLGILKTPAEYGADIAVGEGQPLGLPLSFGGPYVGFMACTEKLMRKLPGRIVGETVDSEGKRGYVLTLQAREQHIRREKASSNICSNEALAAMTTAVYLAAMGPEGLKNAALLSAKNAHLLKDSLQAAGLAPAYDRPFFHEFVTVQESKEAVEKLLQCLAEKDFLGGLSLGDGRILWCATEMNTEEEIKELSRVVKEVLK